MPSGEPRVDEPAHLDVARRLADYAMAFDLLTDLALLAGERDLVDSLLHLTVQLCDAEAVGFVAVDGDDVGPAQVLPPSVPEEDWVAVVEEARGGAARWVRRGDAFLVRVATPDEALGYLFVDRPRLAEHHDEYVNLFLTISPVVALALLSVRQRQLLADQEERFRVLAENASDVVIRIAPGGVVEWVSPSARAAMSVEPPTVVGRRLADLVHPADRPGVEAALVTAATAGSAHVRLRWSRPNGSASWFAGTLRRLPGSDPDAPCLVVGLHDIDPEVRAQEVERRDRARLRATLDTLLDPHVLLTAVRDAAGTIVDFVFADANHAACEFNGLTYDELVGSQLLVLHPMAASAGLFDQYVQVVKTGRPLVLDDWTYPQDLLGGELRIYDVRAVRVGDGLSQSWRDVTDRHRDRAELERQSAELRLMAETAGDVVILSRDGAAEWISPSVLDVLGWRPDELVGTDLLELVHPEDRPRVVSNRVSAPDESITTVRYRARTARGGWLWVEDVTRLRRDHDGRIEAAVAALRDVTDEVAYQDALRASQRQLRGVIDSLLDPWVLLAAVRDQSGRIVDFTYTDANDAACAANHATRQELIGQRLLTLFPGHRDSGLLDAYARVVETGQPLALDDSPFTSPFDGIERRFDNRAVPVGDGISFTWRDVTDRYLARQILKDQADRDPLTGVANRRHLMRRLEDMSRHVPRTGHRIGVLFCDLDHFKDINDNLGHAIGDLVIAAVAQRIRGCLRESDVVARVGGDEFVAVLAGVRDDTDAADVAAKIAAAVDQDIEAAVGHMVRAQVSVGVAVAEAGESPDRLLARADRALYRAKEAGRNRVVIASRDEV